MPTIKKIILSIILLTLISNNNFFRYSITCFEDEILRRTPSIITECVNADTNNEFNDPWLDEPNGLTVINYHLINLY